MIRSVLILLMCSVVTTLFAQADVEQETRFSPEPGYTCERQTQRCSHQNQPNFYMTHIQFGYQAALDLLADTQQIVDLKGEVFYPAANISCDFSTKVCYEGLTPSQDYTQQYFSLTAAERLAKYEKIQAEETDVEVLKPARGVECVRKVKLCYDQKGPNPGLTRIFFGHEQANQLLGRLLRQQATTGD